MRYSHCDQRQNGVQVIDEMDRSLLAKLRRDATQSYAALGQAVGLSAAAAHDRVRKLRERGVIRRTTIDVDPVAMGLPVLAFVLIEAGAWMGEGSTSEALNAIEEIEEAHIIAGPATLLAKVRTATNTDLQDVLRRIYAIDGVTGTQTIVVLDEI